MKGSGPFRLWRMLLLAQIREQPTRFAVTVLAVALGVALGSSVYLVNTSALNEFGLATKRLVGEADIVIRGPREGFAEQVFADLARNASVRAASPVLELDVALSGRNDTLRVLGLDPFQAAELQPALIGEIGDGVFQLFDPDTIYLSSAAAQALQLRRGDRLEAHHVSPFLLRLRVHQQLPVPPRASSSPCSARCSAARSERACCLDQCSSSASWRSRGRSTT